MNHNVTELNNLLSSANLEVADLNDQLNEKLAKLSE